MIRKAIGGHFGQVPMVAKHVLDNRIQGYSIPMGAISRMARASASNSPGHITHIGMGTYVDPKTGNGGKLNDLTTEDLVERITVGGDELLFFKAVPVDVAFIRGTTADSSGNVTMEHESVLSDARLLATAAKASGGVVVAQVKRLAETGSLNARDVHVPGALVDCVVVVPPSDHATQHGMSYFTTYDPSWSHEVRVPLEDIPSLPVSERSVIARRAAMELSPGDSVNLGIGMPDGVASVANEEKVLDRIFLSTECGIHGGMGAAGHDFGPAANADAVVEMNHMFDYYNGGGLDICFLGAAQISKSGDVNVSRLSDDRLTGPGGFMDITQATNKVVYMGAFTAGGLRVKVDDGKLSIAKEGRIKKFVDEVREVTFSGDQAMKEGQNVIYITERAVFKRSFEHPVLELVEVAPGIDVEEHILPHMEFAPVISKNLKTMDPRIFTSGPMNLLSNEFGVNFEDRVSYDSEPHVIYFDWSGMTLSSQEDVDDLRSLYETKLQAVTSSKGPVDAVINLDNFDCRDTVVDAFAELANDMERKYYKSVSRYGGHAFFRQRLAGHLKLQSADELFTRFDADKNGLVSAAEVRSGLLQMAINVSPGGLRRIMSVPGVEDPVDALTKEQFVKAMGGYFEHRHEYEGNST